jgi:transcriptional regulator with XRE-family HTH domain
MVESGASRTVIAGALRRVNPGPSSSAKLVGLRKLLGLSGKQAAAGALVSFNRLHEIEHGRLALTPDETDRLKSFYLKTLRENLSSLLPELLQFEMPPALLAEFLAKLESGK